MHKYPARFSLPLFSLQLAPPSFCKHLTLSNDLTFTMFSKIVLVLATVATAASAVAIPSALDVISPHITAPVAGDVWPVGSIQTITWDTSVVPPQGAIGEILLGHFEDGSSSENLDLGECTLIVFRISMLMRHITLPLL